MVPNGASKSLRINSETRKVQPFEGITKEAFFVNRSELIEPLASLLGTRRTTVFTSNRSLLPVLLPILGVSPVFSQGISGQIRQQKSQLTWLKGHNLVPISSISVQGTQVIFAIHTLRINMQEVSYSTNFAKSSCFPKITNSDFRRFFLDLLELEHIATLIWLTLLIDIYFQGIKNDKT